MILTEKEKLGLLFIAGITSPLWMPVLYKTTLEVWCVAYGIGMQLGLL